MNKKKKFKLIKKAISCATITATLLSLSGCNKKIDCTIGEKHLHLYVNEDNLLSRYINSEKEYVKQLSRTDNYIILDDELKIVSKNSFYIIEDNIEYLTQQMNNYQPRREAYVYDYIYGNYYGYGYGLNFSTGKYEMGFGLKSGWHYDYEWQDISLDEYTTDQVRDITYQFKFYKINEDGTISSQLFNSLEEISEEYKYFTPNTLVKENVSESYHLPKVKSK